MVSAEGLHFYKFKLKLISKQNKTSRNFFLHISNLNFVHVTKINPKYYHCASLTQGILHMATQRTWVINHCTVNIGMGFIK